VAACGANASTSKATAAACSAALTPWTQYIADTNDFKGWVATVGPGSPVVMLPQTAAKVYLGEESKAGIKQASAAGFAELDQACRAFALKYPSFDFSALPGAPTVPT
jgi:hypothetical protein